MKKIYVKYVAILLLVVWAISCSVALAATNDEILNNIDYTLSEKSSIEISQLNGWLIMEGSTASMNDRTRAEEIAKLYSPNVLNYITIQVAEQIKLNVTVLEIDREKIGDLGIAWGTGGVLEGKPALIPSTFYVGQGIKNPAAGTIGDSVISYGAIQARVKALTRQGHARVLSQPSVVTSNSAAAFVNVGGSLPVPKGIGQNYAIDWKDYGIKLNITPNVLQGGQYINTDVSIEIVDIDPASLKNSVTISDGRQSASIPIFKKNNANANLSLKLGETMALGGLLSYELNTDNEGLYGLSDIPILGGLFKDKSQKHSAVDLIVLVTPEVVYSTTLPEHTGSKVADRAISQSLYSNRLDKQVTAGIEQ